jgi:hypothetical protein
VKEDSKENRKEKKKIPAGVWLFAVGILLVGITCNVDTKVSYGFQFGVNEGVSKGGITYLLIQMIGESLKIDLFFNPLGYLLIFLGMFKINRTGKYVKNIKAAAVVGGLLDILKMFLPFFVPQYRLLKPLLAVTALELGAFLVILYSFLLLCKKQVDNYLYMEVGKDLTFSMELYGLAVVFGYILLPFAALYIYFARTAYLITQIAACIAIIYYAWKTIKYSGELGMFTKIMKG